ncbi:uncharacterized protein LOC123311669 [Coccinella septempunctata]|uniref:uncharacterized protein LOC123311669 n=1 Tax=Coccinella septempunctata TaxID=41139 RepID=UPI001D062F92|nr:uncharacterized protein LOC123311669 [Coccinella septempunctata]
MTIVDLASSLNDSYFIPHHCVVKPDSSSTKLRVVFDASAKVMDNPSLNDCLLTGPKLQADIVTILLRFRTHKYVFTADIRQMYRQILVDPVHRKYQRILWRFSPSDPVECYELNTVTYGVSSAPFLALRTLHKLADDEETSFSLAARILRDDVYVDDVVSGSDDLQGSINLRDDLIALLGRGGFELRKWSSNNPCILEGIPDDHQLSQSFSFDEGDFVKILGLRWNPCSDCFSFAVTGIENSCTKRSILSQLARIYDPLGFLTPFTFLMKYFIQLLWVQGLQWDQVPSSEFVDHWSQCRSELSDLQELQISRRLSLSSRVRCELHGFGDTSERGYAAVAYFRFLNTAGEVSISFICAKSKVAPVRRISLPRLELCASLLLAKLISFIKSTYSSIKIDDIYAWSDSKVALAWIKSSPHKWKSFVSNRTTKIQDLVPPERWFHVRSEDNPADFGSRGLTPSKLVRCTMWWSGPSWLSSPAPFNLEVEFSGSDDPLCSAEAGKIALTTCIETTLRPFWQHYDDLLPVAVGVREFLVTEVPISEVLTEFYSI